MSTCKGCDDCKMAEVSENDFEWGKEEELMTNPGTVTKEEIGQVLAEIQSLSQEEDAFDYASSQAVYEYLKEHLDSFFVSDEHVYDEDLGRTFYVVAKDKESYEKYEEFIEHQHHPDATIGVG